MRGGVRRRLRTGIALIDESQDHRRASRVLHGGGQRRDLIAVLGIGGGHEQCQQMAEGIDRQVKLAAIAPFIAVVAGAMAAARGRLARGAIENDRRRGVRAAAHQAQHGREAAGIKPAPRLLIDRVPLRQIAGQVAPGGTGVTIQRSALETSRNASTRCGASGVIRLRYGTTNTHSSSLTSVGYGLRGSHCVSIPQAYQVPNTLYRVSEGI